MDMQFFDENALKALIRRFSTSSDPYAREDLDTVEKAMEAFHNYVNTVVDGEMKLLIQGSRLDGQEYRDAITQYDGDRHSAHEKAIGDAKLINRLAAREGLPPIFTGDETQRHQIADFCLELDQYLVQNRRMKLS
jgi:hypothetical protein